MFDNTFRNCTDLDADKSGVPVHEHENSFLLPQLMMIHAMPSGVSWQKTNCYQLMHNASPSYLFNRFMHALKRRIAP
jgi:hypothetical protein